MFDVHGTLPYIDGKTAPRTLFVPDLKLTPRQQETLRSLERQCGEAARELTQIGFVLQGSVRERRMLCGKAGCRCRTDPRARHGPYYQWSWKEKGRTVSTYLTKDQADICMEWARNNRAMEKILKRLRAISLRAARLFEIPPK
jgi:hypothetical protein